MSPSTLHDEPSDRRSYQQSAIRSQMTVRQVATDYPACRDVFESFGVTESHGRFGHFQPLSHFAFEHNVELDELLEQLSSAAGVPIDRWSQEAERIHRGFLAAALAITLTVGAGWGAWLLWQIGVTGDFDGVPADYIVAHGEAQLWGFIGLFIVGISLRTVLKDAIRTRRRQLICHSLLIVTLVALVAGFAWALSPDSLSSLGLVSAFLLLTVSLFFWSVQLCMLASIWRATWARAVIGSGLWLTIWAVVTCFLRWKTGVEGPGAFQPSERLLLIELAVFGFAMNSIYGFGQMLLPGFLRTGRPRLWAIESAHWLHNTGLTALVIGGTRSEENLLPVVGISMMAAGATLYAVGQRAFIGKRRKSKRIEQGHWLLDVYIPLAFFWLITSMLLLSVAYSYEALTGTRLPHAFAGAVRHALTVGFMTTLILGVGQRLIPVLEHSVLSLPNLVGPILALIAIGNLLRVVTEFATMRVPAAYAVMPFSALLEWLALLLFTVSVCWHWSADSYHRSGRVTQTSSLAVLLANAPWIEDLLIEQGSTYLVRARTVPRELTIGSFAESECREPEEFVRYVNSLLKRQDEVSVEA